jgi:Fic family protein
MKPSQNEEPATIENLVDQYQKLIGPGIIDYERFNQMLITHHSTAIEGSTLTLGETQILLDKGLTAAGKPLYEHLMVTDHQAAQEYVIRLARERTPLSVPTLQHISHLVMKNTGGIHNTILGSFDSSKGDLRTTSASSTDGRIFMNAQKIPRALDIFCREFNEQLPHLKAILPIYDFSFMAHFTLVSIHPFGDGNGRLSRLVMNYAQHYHHLPPSLVFKESRLAYLQSLEQSRQQESPEPIVRFINGQLQKFLQEEIHRLAPQQELQPRKGPQGLTLFF